MSVSEETERMKLEIVAGYVTTAYTNMVVLLITAFLTVFVAFFALLIAKQITFIEFGIPMLIVEGFVLYGLVGQYRKFDRRMGYLDTLIEKLESSPPKALGRLRIILDEVRKA